MGVLSHAPTFDLRPARRPGVSPGPRAGFRAFAGRGSFRLFPSAVSFEGDAMRLDRTSDLLGRPVREVERPHDQGVSPTYFVAGMNLWKSQAGFPSPPPDGDWASRTWSRGRKTWA